MASEVLEHPTVEARRAQRVARRRALRRGTMLALLALAAAVLALKLVPSPAAETVRHFVALRQANGPLSSHLSHVLLVPLGALFAVFFRLTLGVRVLGPFRSVLLAIAFRMTGLVVGLTFVIVVLATIVAVRPLLARMRLPQYSRLSATLSTVALVIVLTVLVGRAFGWQALTLAGYFPIVVLSLTAEGFASALRREGPRSALWRGFATVALGVFIAQLSAMPGFEALLFDHPELLLVEVALMLATAEFLGFRLFAALNPPVKKRRRKKRRKRLEAKRKAMVAEYELPSSVPTSTPESSAS